MPELSLDALCVVSLLVPNGWQPLRWAEELNRKASACEEMQPELAALYRNNAGTIRELHRPRGRPLHRGVVVAE